MSYPQRNSSRRMLDLDAYRVVLAMDAKGTPRLWWADGVTTAQARRDCERLMAAMNDYFNEVGQPQPPRTSPSPHYRDRRETLPTRIEE